MQEEILIQVNYLSNLLPAGLVLLRWRRLGFSQRMVGGLIVCLVLMELSSRSYFMPYVNNNMFLFHLYSLLEFTVLALVYRRALHAVPVKRLIVRVLVPGFLLVAVLDATLWHHPLRQTNAVARSVEAIILVWLTLLYLRQLLDELVVDNLGRHPMFWIAVAVLLYFSVTFFLFATDAWRTAALPVLIAKQLWQLNLVANIVFNLLLARALWLPAAAEEPSASAWS